MFPSRSDDCVCLQLTPADSSSSSDYSSEPALYFWPAQLCSSICGWEQSCSSHLPPAAPLSHSPALQPISWSDGESPQMFSLTFPLTWLLTKKKSKGCVFRNRWSLAGFPVVLLLDCLLFRTRPTSGARWSRNVTPTCHRGSRLENKHGIIGCHICHFLWYLFFCTCMFHWSQQLSWLGFWMPFSGSCKLCCIEVAGQ